MRSALFAALLLSLSAPLAAAATAAEPAMDTTLLPFCPLLGPQYGAVCAFGLDAARILCEVLFFWWPAVPPVCISVA